MDASVAVNGFDIVVDGRSYPIRYPAAIWKSLPKSTKKLLIENITYADTHLLPLLLVKDKIIYKTPYPFFESLLYRNQLFDMTFCEGVDKQETLSYLRKLYNLDIIFESRDTTIPEVASSRQESDKVTAVLPFTFGKESLVSTALCKELGIEPVLVYSQEPSQPHEESFKLNIAKNFSRKYSTPFHFIEHAPGLFRYGKAFALPKETELGWGTQTTLLALLSVPFLIYYNAQYIFFGSEHSNNDFEVVEGWKVFCSYDQTTFWTPQQNMMTRALTGGHCRVNSLLEPLEELTIFYILHNRYKQYAKYQFSCFAMDKLHDGSQWCHNCSKCFKNYLFAVSTGMGSAEAGFKRSLLTVESLKKFYLPLKLNEEIDLDFALAIILKNNQDLIPESVRKEIKNKLKSWDFYMKHFFNLKSTYNLPEKYKSKALKIFKHELESLRKIIK